MAQPPRYNSGDSMTEEFIAQTITCFRTNVPLDKGTIFNLINAAQKTFRPQPTLIKIDPGEGERLHFVGIFMTKGQLFELLKIFALNGNPCEKNIYLFNGDFVDRGPCSVEVTIILYAYKLLHPGKFFINRGNHETVHQDVGQEFKKECVEKYGLKLFDAFSNSFDHLPIATVIAKRYFVVHGGLPVDTDFALDHIRALSRSDEKSEKGDLKIQLLWNDPIMPLKKSSGPRGGGQLFDQTVVKAFLEKEKLSMVIRSHEFTKDMPKGYKKDGDCLTIFSAANYKGGVNSGAYVNITSNTCEILTFESPCYPKWYNPYKYLW